MGTDFYIGGAISNQGSSAEGLLLNSRMVQALVDFEDERSAERFAQEGLPKWDPEQNTDEFIAALPAYRAHGLNAVTVNLQGGNPLPAPPGNDQPWIVSAYDRHGHLDPHWAARLDRVLRGADDHGLLVVVGLFYFGQDHRLADEAAVQNAVDEVVAFLIDGAYDNVLVEIANESDVHYDHDVLRPSRVHQLIRRVQERSDGRLLASTSFGGGRLPPESVIQVADFILLHGNNQTPEDIRSMVEELEESDAYRETPKPVMFNEDSTSLNNMKAALDVGASWGYHDKTGFQVPPVDWDIDTPEKRAFFELVEEVTHS